MLSVIVVVKFIDLVSLGVLLFHLVLPVLEILGFSRISWCLDAEVLSNLWHSLIGQDNREFST